MNFYRFVAAICCLFSFSIYPSYAAEKMLIQPLFTIQSKSKIVDPSTGEYLSLYLDSIYSSFIPIIQLSENLIPVLKTNHEDLSVIIKHSYTQLIANSISPEGGLSSRGIASLPLPDRTPNTVNSSDNESMPTPGLEEVKNILKEIIKQ